MRCTTTARKPIYLSQSNNVLFENVTVAGGILLQGITAPMGKVTVRNSILSKAALSIPESSKPEYANGRV